MSEFKPTDAALEGFRIARENPRTFGVWVLLNIGVNVLAVLIDVFMPANVRRGLDALSGSDTLSLTQFMDAIILSAPVLILGLVVVSTMAAAVYREIFRHSDAKYGYLRLGGDEVRLMVVTVLGFLVLMAAEVAATVVLAILFTILTALFPQAQGLVSFLALVAVVAVGFFVYVKFSLAPVATFAEQRVTLFESWTLTKGHFWELAFAYFLMWVSLFLVWFLLACVCFGVAGSIVLMTGGQLADVKGVFTASEGSLKSYLNVGVVAYAIVGSAFSALSNAVIAAPGAVAYQALHGWPPPGRSLNAQPEAV